jgi:hypothetical protein
MARAEEAAAVAVRGRPAGLLGRLRPRRETLWGYAFISPWLVGFVGLYLIPLAAVP